MGGCQVALEGVVALHSRRIWECQKPRRWKECREGHPAETYSDDLPSLRPKSYSDMFGRRGSGVGVAQVSAQNPGARTWATQPKHARHALFLFGFEDHAIADRNWCMRGDGYAAWKVEPYFWNRPIRELRLRQLKLINNLKLTSGSSRK